MPRGPLVVVLVSAPSDRRVLRVSPLVVQVPPLELVAAATVVSSRLASLGLAVLAVASLSLPVGALDGDGLCCVVSGRRRRLLALVG